MNRYDSRDDWWITSCNRRPVCQCRAMDTVVLARSVTGHTSSSLLPSALEEGAVLSGTFNTTLCGEPVVLDPRGAMMIVGHGALVVSDLHLGKAASLNARGGGRLPPYDAAATLSTLDALVQLYAPEIVVSLGDSFHDATLDQRLSAADRLELQTLVHSVPRWVWVTGNHDPQAPTHLGGEARGVLTLGPLTLRHEPMDGPAPGEIAGHLHPCAVVKSRGRAVRRRCFAWGEDRVVMPAMGAFAGGLNVCDRAFAAHFTARPDAMMLGRDKVWPIPAARLQPTP